MFTAADLTQIEAHGQCVETVEKQLANFRTGFPFLNVVRAAAAGDGINVLTENQISQAVATYNAAIDRTDVVKFVPASGAATRMFKELFAFVNEGKRGAGIDTLLANIERFAFWPELKALLPKDADDRTVVQTILNNKGLNYGAMPKGLICFHATPEGGRKAVEEHLVEGAMYANVNGFVRLHFTVSAEHRAAFEARLAVCQKDYEQRFGVNYVITFSEQKPATDTIAVNPDNTPFRTADGRLLFRPAGHGALIENLNEIDADLVFIKNIDNVTIDALKSDTVTYKKVLAGLLLTLQTAIFAHLEKIDRGEETLREIATFIETRLCVKLPPDYDGKFLRKILNRPIRVCGMVRNQGEPGGGPFWVAAADGTQSLQIAETNQIAPEAQPLMQQATHFNPVDLVCGRRDFQGHLFDLRHYTDPTMGFISTKSFDGRELRAQELPGLWNGAMADWNTIFVEVPITTFSPVKVVNDLLRPEHQAKINKNPFSPLL